MNHLLLQSDARRIPLVDGCVQCVVTSPPYFALRDYGTARWVGGDPACEHTGVRRGHSDDEKQATSAGTSRDPIHGGDCRLCGATRIDRQIGLEATPRAYIEAMLDVFAEVRRVMRNDATLWLNIGDSYNNAGSRNNGTGLDGKRRGGVGDTDGSWRGATETYRDLRHALKGEGIKCKDLIGIPWMLAFALRDELGFYLRSEIVWAKKSPMPESVTDRPTSATEKIFLFSKSERYYYDQDAYRVPVAGATVERDRHTRITTGKDGAYAVQHDHETPSNPSGRNLWNYWLIGAESFRGAHFAVFPTEIPRRAISLGTSERGCCPACGAPWERVTETAYENPGNRTTNGQRSIDRKHIEFGTAGYEVRLEKRVRTVGWQPSCACPEHDPVPCLTFDPFNGAGTTGVVATGLGRRYVGLDLNREYLDMAARRISRPHAPIAAAPRDEPLPLFAMEDAS